jgi:hypothetical protein
MGLQSHPIGGLGGGGVADLSKGVLHLVEEAGFVEVAAQHFCRQGLQDHTGGKEGEARGDTQQGGTVLVGLGRVAVEDCGQQDGYQADPKRPLKPGLPGRELLVCQCTVESTFTQSFCVYLSQICCHYNSS